MTNEQGPEFVNPGKRAFAAEAAFVDFGIEQPFSTTLDGLAIAFVLGDVGNDPIVEADFASVAGIEGTISVEVSTGNLNPQSLHRLKGCLQVRLEVKRIVMMTRQYARRGQDIALGIGDGQKVTGLGSFARLVSHTLPSLLGNGVAAVPVQPRQVQVGLNARHAVLPDPFKAAVPAPFPKMVVHRLPTALFFVGSAATGSSAHWQPV